ncbi:MAG TPA: DNA topoisomerase IB, partial [Minicystis sp.]|nr:DNA topoisomerase IB [Minicystis sp.]
MEIPIVLGPEASAKAAGLVYVDDARPGIRRRRVGKGFVYVDASGRRIRDEDELARIRRIGVPPAWTDVWICSDPRGHVQATGRDARGRKQYRYHARWREVRDETKYHRTIAFGQALPRVRAATAAHLVLPGLPRDKVLATVVRLLETTLIRVGNEEYARDNASCGL